MMRDFQNKVETSHLEQQRGATKTRRLNEEAGERQNHVVSATGFQLMGGSRLEIFPVDWWSQQSTEV